MIRFGYAFAFLLLLHHITAQPLQQKKDESSLPASPVEMTSTNETENQSSESNSSSFSYNHPSNFPHFGDMDSNPFRAMQQMLSNMEQRFNAMFGQGQGMQNVSEMQNVGGMQSSSSVISSQSGFEGNGDFFGGLFQQPCRQTFNENELVIKCNVTGYDPNEIKVDVKGNQLTIVGKRVEENPDGQNSTTQFQQSLLLSDYNMEKLTSDTSNGVLTVSVPRIPHQITDEKKNQSAVDIA